jgi:hypothetical protein
VARLSSAVISESQNAQKTITNSGPEVTIRLDYDSVTHGLVLDASLPEDALQRARLQIGAKFAGNGDSAFLELMGELAVAWLPFVAARVHPSSSGRRMISLTVVGM